MLTSILTFSNIFPDTESCGFWRTLYFFSVFFFLDLFIFFLVTLFPLGLRGSWLLCGLSLAAVRAGLLCSWGAQASRCGGAPLQSADSRARGLSSRSSRLQSAGSSCGPRAGLPRSVWVPGPGLEPVSPAVTGRVFTAEPPRAALLFPLCSSSQYDHFCLFRKGV